MSGKDAVHMTASETDSGGDLSGCTYGRKRCAVRSQHLRGLRAVREEVVRSLRLGPRRFVTSHVTIGALCRSGVLRQLCWMLLHSQQVIRKLATQVSITFFFPYELYINIIQRRGISHFILSFYYLNVINYLDILNYLNLLYYYM